MVYTQHGCYSNIQQALFVGMQTKFVIIHHTSVCALEIRGTRGEGLVGIGRRVGSGGGG